jgi:hypothetical protein
MMASVYIGFETVTYTTGYGFPPEAGKSTRPTSNGRIEGSAGIDMFNGVYLYNKKSILNGLEGDTTALEDVDGPDGVKGSTGFFLTGSAHLEDNITLEGEYITPIYELQRKLILLHPFLTETRHMCFRLR